MGNESDSDRSVPSPSATLIVVSSVQFLTPFMGSAINVALPVIGREFSAGAVHLSLIQMSYLLAVAMLLLPMGRFADIYGRKRIFILGIILSILTTIALGQAGSVNMLILFRFLQGAGAAMITSTSIAILSSVFPIEKRGRAMGVIVAFTYIGLASGPTIAGVITHQMGWRWLFYFMVPIQAAALTITLLKLKGEWIDAEAGSFDWFGGLIYILSMFLAVVGISQLDQLDSAWIMAVAGVLGLALFFKFETGVKKPMLDVLYLWRNKPFSMSNLATLINYAASFGVVFLFTLYLQYIKGMSAQQAGFFLMIQPSTQAVFSPLAGRWADRVSPFKLATLGMAICGAGLVGATFIESQTPLFMIVLIMVVLGVGFGVFSSPNMTAIMGSVPPRRFGLASSLVATMRTVGMLVSMTIITIILSLYLGDRSVSGETSHEFIKSLHISMLCLSLMSFMGIFLSLGRNKVLKKFRAAPDRL